MGSGIWGPHEVHTWGRRNSNSLRKMELMEGPTRDTWPKVIKERDEGEIGLFWSM